MTDITFGFDTALGIATEAIDRLHSTAHSHHRIIVVEIMGHRAGWLALGAGIAGGADVILIPEIPYRIESIAEAIRERRRKGRRFSIVAVAEGALSPAGAMPGRGQGCQGAEEKEGRALPGERRDPLCRPHPAPGPRAGEGNRSGGAGHDPRPPAARRHALGRRP